jgi:hypothetical protein
MLTAFAAALVLAPPASDYRERFPLPGAAIPDGWGINIHTRGSGPKTYDMMKELGINWARMDMLWGRVERVKGVYDFSEYDLMINRLLDRGIR